MTTTETAATPPVPLRRNANFIRLWIGAGMSHIGSTLGMTAFPLLALWTTGSATLTGLVAFASSLPTILVQLPAGAIVDRWDRRKLMLCWDTIGAIAIASVALAVAFDHVWIPHLMLAAFLESTRGIFYDLAERATVRNVVPAVQLSTALAQNEARGSTIGLLGQPIAGYLFTVTRWLPFLASAIADVIAIISVLLIRKSFKPPRATERRPIHVEIGEGIRWIWQERFARVLIALFAGSNFVFQIVFLSVMVIVHGNNQSPSLVGIITAVGGIGGLAGALSAPRITKRFSFRATWIVGFALWTLLIPLVAIVRDPLLLGLMYAGNSMVGGVFNVAGWTFQVQNTPDKLQGRVNATARFLCSGANSLAGLLGGFLLDRIGVTWTGTLLGAGVLVLLVTTITSASMRAKPPSVDVSEEEEEEEQEAKA